MATPTCSIIRDQQRHAVGACVGGALQLALGAESDGVHEGHFAMAIRQTVDGMLFANFGADKFRNPRLTGDGFSLAIGNRACELGETAVPPERSTDSRSKSPDGSGQDRPHRPGCSEPDPDGRGGGASNGRGLRRRYAPARAGHVQSCALASRCGNVGNVRSRGENFRLLRTRMLRRIVCPRSSADHLDRK